MSEKTGELGYSQQWSASDLGVANALATVVTEDDTTLLASAGEDAFIRLWNPITGEPVGSPLTGHTGGILDLAAVPGPKGATLLASAGYDGTIRLWNPATGQPVGSPLSGHTGESMTWPPCRVRTAPRCSPRPAMTAPSGCGIRRPASPSAPR